MKKWITLLLLAGLCAFGWTHQKKRFGLGQPAKAEAGRNTPIAVTEDRAAEYSIQVSGEVQAAAELDVKPEVTGCIKKLHVNRGDQVKAGDLL